MDSVKIYLQSEPGFLYSSSADKATTIITDIFENVKNPEDARIIRSTVTLNHGPRSPNGYCTRYTLDKWPSKEQTKQVKDLLGITPVQRP